MGLLNSLQTSISGIQASSQRMGSVSDNITNAGTAGFKGSNAEFEEALSTSIDEHSNPVSAHAGTKHSQTKMNMGQGDISRSTASTDMAINGEGFFRLETKFGTAYTRDGSFQFNKEGELVNGDGHKVQGYRVGEDGKVTTQQGPIKLERTEKPGTGTSKVDLVLNLDARENTKVFDPLNPRETSNFSKEVKIFDAQGKEKYITVYFSKIDNNQWQYNAMVDGEDYPGGVKGTKYPGGSGVLTFNNGKLQSENKISGNFNFKDTGAQEIDIDFGESITEGGDGGYATTTFGTKSSVSKFRSNGNKEATLKSIGFGPDGMLQAYFDNGEVDDVSQLMLGKFQNNQGLKKIGGNLFVETNSSGQASLGNPGTEGRGNILSQSVEMSNVDISNEYVNLMKSQATFAANSKTLSVSDQLLQKVINMKN
ncbi:MAG: hypothetical protein BM556_00445 [Bacteriovorax sp. MedPE-SWde]|nr:MAG: hypothetical protein BM556_00445 [Bacteriovorax sp. MedPE-SWde]